MSQSTQENRSIQIPDVKEVRDGKEIRDVKEAGEWLDGLINVEKRPDFAHARLGLGPIQALLERLDNPHDGLRFIHIAGSKGKGSTALLAEAVLEAAGVRVGTFTSPHLERWTERVRIGGREVDGPLLAAAVERVRPHVEAMRYGDPSQAPTFIDETTAAALVCFREAGVELAILEVGLGGRLDSTNVVTPVVACITSIELEHTDTLGDSLAAIAGEKAGILKPAVAAVIGVLPRAAAAAVQARAAEVGVEPDWAGDAFAAEVLEEGPDGAMLRMRDGDVVFDARLPLLGRHQVGNAALALACVRRALDLDDDAFVSAAIQGLAAVTLPGRIERLERDPCVLVDGAHTAASAQALASVLRGIERRRTRLVLSISAGKDTASILASLVPLANEVTVTRAEPRRSLSPAEVGRAVREVAPGVELRVVPNPQLAVRAAYDGLEAGDCLCVTGSVYLAGIARRILWQPRSAADVAVTRNPAEARRDAD